MGLYAWFALFEKSVKDGRTKEISIGEILISERGSSETIKDATHENPNAVVCTKNM